MLANALNRLSEGEQADRQIPIELPAMDQQDFMKWAHTQLREGVLRGPEWEGLDRQYRVTDYLLAIQDAFDAAIDRMIVDDPYAIADDIVALLEWQGGVRTFDTAMRLCLCTVDVEEDEPNLIADEILLPEDGPLASWSRMLDLSTMARTDGITFDKHVADEEKQRVSAQLESRLSTLV